MTTPHILLMEDDLFFARVIRELFEREGWRVRHATNGEEGMNLIAEERPDVVLLDVTLPKKNGFEVLDEIVANDNAQGMFVMMLTELAAREDVERCLANGACEYLIKPHVSPAEIVSRVRGRLTVALSEGFALAELLIVIGVILLSSVFAFWQYGAYQARSRDAARVSNIRLIQSSLNAAGQDGLIFVGCTSGDALSQCRICESAACADERTRQYLPETLFAEDKDRDVCGKDAVRPCRWIVEQDGDVSLAPGQSRIRFLLEKKFEGFSGGKTHVILPDGRVE